MPTLRSHTHLQAIQADTQTKACKRVCLPNRTAGRPVDDRKEQRRHNTGLASLIFNWQKWRFCAPQSAAAEVNHPPMADSASISAEPRW
jgi:hypothetical protein